MKKKLKIIFTLLFVSLGLIACGQEDADGVDTGSQAELIEEKEKFLAEKEVFLEEKEASLEEKESELEERESKLEEKEKEQESEQDSSSSSAEESTETSVEQTSQPEPEESSVSLDGYDTMEIEYARILLMTDRVDPSSPFIYVDHIPAGTPVAEGYEDTVKYPYDVTVLYGEYGYMGSLYYTSHGDGNITIYPHPGRWHQEDQSPEGYRAYTQEILDNGETVYVDPGDDANVIHKIESVEFVYQ